MSSSADMRVLLYGAKGWIGSQFCEYLAKTPAIVVEGKARLGDDDAIEMELADIKPTHVVSFTGRTHGVYKGVPIHTIDYLEQPGTLRENLNDNLYGPVRMALAAVKYGFHYTYLGTGCIFNYDEEHMYESEEHGFKVDDAPNYFGSSYSVVKGYTDRLCHVLPVLNVRIRMPITADWTPRNFITKIVNYAKICSIKNSMTVLADFFPVIYDLMKAKAHETVNCVNPGLISHNEVLEMYKEIVNPSHTWVNFSSEEQSKILLAARSNNCLDTSAIESRYPYVPHIRDSVRAVLIRMSETMNGTASPASVQNLTPA